MTNDRLDHLPYVRAARSALLFMPRALCALDRTRPRPSPVFAISLVAFVHGGSMLGTLCRQSFASRGCPLLGMEYHLAADGISLTLALVTGLTAVSAVLFSWDVEHRPNEFFFWLLLVVGGSYGVFLSADLFLLFVFYELVIVPKYFLIAIWGSTNKEYGAMKLTLYSFAGGALVFLGILAAYVTAGSLDLHQLSQYQFSPEFQSWAFPGHVPRVRSSRRHLAVAHLGADRSRRCADRGFDAAGRHRDETRRLRRVARGDESCSQTDSKCGASGSPCSA